MAFVPILFFTQFMDLAGHVCGVDQCKLFARGSGDVPIWDERQIRVGWHVISHRHINTAMNGGPTPVDRILVEASSRPFLAMVMADEYVVR